MNGTNQWGSKNSSTVAQWTPWVRVGWSLELDLKRENLAVVLVERGGELWQKEDIKDTQVL